MDTESLRNLLLAVERGETDLKQAMAELSRPVSIELEEATVDLDRERRCGFPEVIFGQNKTVSQVVSVAESLAGNGASVLATRLVPEALVALSERFPDGTRSDQAGLFWMPHDPQPPQTGTVAVISAGTSDQSVAEEAAWTATAYGVQVKRIRDVGVAGLHRLLSHKEVLTESSALVVVAGMEGALPSVIGGLTDRPVIGVPTSVGYGASFGGVAALLAMLNSCAAGVTVVNIDNGFGAAVQASKIARLHSGAAPGKLS